MSHTGMLVATLVMVGMQIGFVFVQFRYAREVHQLVDSVLGGAERTASPEAQEIPA